MARFMTEKEVEEKYGFPVKRLRNHRKAGKGLPYVRVSGSIYYNEKKIEEYIEKNTVYEK